MERCPPDPSCMRGVPGRGIRTGIGGEDPPASKTAPDPEGRGLGVRKRVG
jgi:hypothetical protein